MSPIVRRVLREAVTAALWMGGIALVVELAQAARWYSSRVDLLEAHVEDLQARAFQLEHPETDTEAKAEA